jgi:uncharacterized protein YbjT (DUF2867 family)
VAKALAGGFLKHGHDATLGTRTPAKLAEWSAKDPEGHVAVLGARLQAADIGDLPCE